MPRDFKKEWENSPAGKHHKEVTALKHEAEMRKQVAERARKQGLVVAEAEAAEALKPAEAEASDGETVEQPSEAEIEAEAEAEAKIEAEAEAEAEAKIEKEVAEATQESQ